LVAPGLAGTAERQEELLGGRADEEPPATAALSAALQLAGMEQVHGVQIEATEVDVLGGDVRGADDEGLMLLQVPDLGADATQVLLALDEAGVATWHFGKPAGPEAPDSIEFAVRRDVADAPIDGAADPGQRGLAGLIGRKLLSVLVFPAVKAGVEFTARHVARWYEDRSRPYRLRRFVPGNSRTAGADDLAVVGWGGVAPGRALLFVHGTFSTSHGGFAALPDDTLSELWKRYGQRVFAFDHPSLSATPAENAATLLSLLPADRHFDVDIVCHSRGGLVARALADAAVADPRLTVNSTVFVGTPNRGTALADNAHIKNLVNRMTTMLNLVPDGPLSAVTDILAGVLDVVKVLALGLVDGLPGLQAMDPTDATLATLGGGASPTMPRYAVGADFEPTGSLLRLVQAANLAADAVFADVANDLVVPTSVADGPPGLAGFPIAPENRLDFGRSPSIWHCAYFSQPQTSRALLDWCRAN
jgi:hypothetical protein